MTPAAAKSRGRAPRRRARGSLSREEILQGAWDLLEQDGFGQFSMPVLAEHLRAGVTSIYWYFRSKDDLLAALADKVSKELALRMPPVADGPWDKELTHHYTVLRDLMHRTPVYREVLVHHPQALFVRSVMAPTVLRRLEEGLELLKRAGLPADDAFLAMMACGNYTRGFVSSEHAMASELRTAEGRSDPIGTASPIATLDDKAFTTGLQLLVDGIRVAAASKGTRWPVVAPAAPADGEDAPIVEAPASPVARSRKSQRRARGSLSQGEILDAAQQLVRAHGLRALSMPLLAKQLGAGVTSIYWYFRSKDDLLVAMAERAFAEFYRRVPPPGSGPWDEELFTGFVAYRRELLRAPVCLELAASRPRFLFSRPTILPIVSERQAQYIALLTKAAFSTQKATRVYHALLTYTQSFALLEYELEQERAEVDLELIEEIGRVLAGLDPVEFRMLAGLADFRALLKPDDRHFQAGLHLMIEGARAAATAGPGRRSAGSGKAPASTTSRATAPID